MTILGKFTDGLMFFVAFCRYSKVNLEHSVTIFVLICVYQVVIIYNLCELLKCMFGFLSFENLL